MSLSLYIHYPFCSNICDYCDFYKVTYDSDFEKIYFSALKTELQLAKESLAPEQRTLNTIYIGGGTPSLIDMKKLELFLSELKKDFKLSDKIEFSFEINPESIDKNKFSHLKELGINRPIFGMQSFNLKILKPTHPLHELSCEKAKIQAQDISHDPHK